MNAINLNNLKPKRFTIIGANVTLINSFVSGLIISHTEIKWYLPYFTKEIHTQPIIQSRLFLFICSHRQFRSTSHLEIIIIYYLFPSKIQP